MKKRKKKMKPLEFNDFSPALKWVTTGAFLILTSGLGTMIWQVSAKNGEFEQLKKDQLSDFGNRIHPNQATKKGNKLSPIWMFCKGVLQRS